MTAPLVLIALILMAIVVIVYSFVIFKLFSDKHRNQKTLRMQDEIMYIHGEYIMGTQKKQYDLAKLKHDFRAQLITLNRLCRQNDPTACWQFLDSMNTDATQLDFADYDTGHKVATVMVNYYAALAKNNNIRFDYDGYLGGNAKIPDCDLNALFHNLLSNALEECLRLPGDSGRYIEILVNSRYQSLVLNVSNSCRTELMILDISLLGTSKADKASHGFGLGIISGIVGKHGGTVEMRCHNGQWVAEIVFTDFYLSPSVQP